MNAVACFHKRRRSHQRRSTVISYGTPDPQKLGCKTFLRPEVRRHLVHQCYIHKLQQDCHCGEVRCDIDLQTPGCMRFRPARVECRTVHRHCFQNRQHVHRFGEGVYDANLQTPGCRTFPHLLMKCYIVILLQMASPQANGMNMMIGAKHRIVCRKFKRQPMERVVGTSCSSLVTIQDLASTRQVMQV